MRPLLSKWTLLLVVAIAFVVLMIWTQVHPPEEEDPLGQAVGSISEGFGLEVEPRPGPRGGLTVKAVRPGGPAERLGFRTGDRILAVGDRSIWHAINLQEGLAQSLGSGYPAAVMVESKGTYHSIIIGRRLHSRSGSPARAR